MGKFTHEQQIIIEKTPPFLVLAGPGSGKTTIVGAKIANDVHEKGIQPSNILAITFSNSGVHRMNTIIPRFVGEKAATIRVETIHRLSWQLVRNFLGFFRKTQASDRPSLIGPDDAEKVIKLFLDSDEAKRTLQNSNLYSPTTALDIIEKGRAEFFTILEKHRSRVKDAPNLYEAWKAISEEVAQDEKTLLATTFDLFLVEKLNAFHIGALPFLAATLALAQTGKIVQYAKNLERIYYDEFQDASAVDIAVVTPFILAAKGNIVALGDPFQTIYSFRGALGSNAFSLLKSVVEKEVHVQVQTLFLTENHRNPEEIIGTSIALLSDAMPTLASDPRNEMLTKLYDKLREHYQKRRENISRLSESWKQNLYIIPFTSPTEEVRWTVQALEGLAQHVPDQTKIAILVPPENNNQEKYLQLLEKELLKANIPFETIGSKEKESIKHSKTLKTLLAILLVITNNHNTDDLATIAESLQLGKAFTHFIEQKAAFLDPEGKDILEQFLETLDEKNTEKFPIQVLEEILQERRKLSLASEKAKETLARILSPQKPIHTLINNLAKKEASRKEFIETIMEDLITQKGEKLTTHTFALWFQETLQFSTPEDALLLGIGRNARLHLSIVPIRLVKGLEFDFVFWLGFGKTLAKTTTEELFLTYTALTRARRALVLSFIRPTISQSTYATYAQKAEKFSYAAKKIIATKQMNIAATEVARKEAFRKLLESIPRHSLNHETYSP